MTRIEVAAIASTITTAITADQARQRIAADEIRDRVSHHTLTADEWFEHMLTSQRAS